MNNFPITRYNPGELPEPPQHFSVTASKWFWKLAAWCKVRRALTVDVETVEDVAQLMALYEKSEADHDREMAVMNANIRLAAAGFCEADLQHLDIPIHEIFEDHKQNLKQRNIAIPEN